MTDIPTPVLGLVKQTIGGNRNTWGAILNTCMDLIEGAIYGQTSKVVTGSGDVTLTNTERRQRILNFTGTLVADQTIIVANLVGRWTVRNATTGAFALKFKTAGGTAVTVPQGGHCGVWCDGNDVMYLGLSTRWRDTQLTGPDGTVTAPGFSFASETDSGLYRSSANVFSFSIAGILRMVMAPASFIYSLTGGAFTIEVDGAPAFQVTSAGATVSGALVADTLTVGGTTPVPIGASMPYDGITEPNGWKFRNGQALSRTTYAALLGKITAVANATRNGTTTLSAVDTDLTGLGLEGAKIEGSGITNGTTIASLTSTSITLSQAASGSGTMAIRVLPHGNGDGSTTFNVPDRRGRGDVGRDNMGGTSADRLTGQTGGIDGDKLGNTGGAETDSPTIAKLPAVTPAGSVSSVVSGGTVGGTSSSVNTPNGAGVYPTGAATIAVASTFTGTPFGGATAHNNVQPVGVSNSIIFTGVFA